MEGALENFITVYKEILLAPAITTLAPAVLYKHGRQLRDDKPSVRFVLKCNFQVSGIELLEISQATSVNI